MHAVASFPAVAITVLNLKGGVGKTHTNWLLASVCQERQRRVLLLDTDIQGNLSNSFLPAEEQQPGIAAIFNPAEEADLSTLIHTTPFSHIDIIPSGPGLALFDLTNQKEWEKGDLHLSFVDPVSEMKRSYDFLVFDCPPRLSLVSFAALCASDAVIIPMEAADWGAQGIMQVTAAIEYVQKRFNPRLKLLGYLVSRFKRARVYQQTYLRQLRSHFGNLAFDTVIPDLARFEKSVTDRIPISLYAPRSEEARIARQLFTELQRRVGKQQRRGRAGRQPSVQQASVVAA